MYNLSFVILGRIGAMRSLFFLVLLSFQSLFCFAADFDVVVVGTSPICLIEALYRYHSGSSVMILEKASECGGSWKSIDVCGVPHVDLGCHQLWSDQTILKFLEEYVGCKTVSLDHPHEPFDPNNSPSGFYLSAGCYEMVHNLLELISKTDITLLLNHPLESVTISPDKMTALVKSKELEFTASKILCPTYAVFDVESDFKPLSTKEPRKSQYYHLYLLIQDSTPPSFSFKNGCVKGVSRLMNLTPFVGLEGTGTQLIVFQTHSQSTNQIGEAILDQLKTQKLVGESAYIVKADTYTYEQCSQASPTMEQINQAAGLIETLSTSHINGMAKYIPKWKQVLKPHANGG